MKKLGLFFALLFCCSAVFAASFKNIIFFGDSLSDDGNLYRVLKVIPASPPYYFGRFSNGPVWSEIVAADLKKQGIGSLNEAVGDAAVMLRGPFRDALPITLSAEIYNYLKDVGQADPTALYVIWIGANDYLDEQKEDPIDLVRDVTQGIQQSIEKLINAGAVNFLILNMPDLSRVPKASIDGNTARLGLLSEYHNTVLPQVLNDIQKHYPNVTFTQVDAYYFLNDLLDHPGKYSPTITNTTDPCWTGDYLSQQQYTAQDISYLNHELKINLPNDTHIQAISSGIMTSTVLSTAYQLHKLLAAGLQPCDDPSQYVFWDKVHPTTVVHQLLAQIVENALTNQIAGTKSF